MSDAMSQSNPAGGGGKVLKMDYAPPPYEPSWRERINPRMIGVGVVGLTIVGLIGAMFFTWAQQVVTGGIVQHGDYAEVNLKAMSLFEMDQSNGRNDDIPSKWRALDGTKVQLIGEVWNPEGVGPDGCRGFELCYSIANCCFGGPPKVQHFVFAKIPDGAASAQVGIGNPARVEGVIHVGIQKDPDTGKILSIYRVDVAKVSLVG